VVSDDDKSEEDALREAISQVAPGSPGEAVCNFLTCVRVGDFEYAATHLAPELVELDLRRLDLGFLDGSGWGISGRPRAVGPDTEVVSFAYEL
jgi:hypothetical protein